MKKFLILCSFIYITKFLIAGEITDIIKPVHLASGQTDTLLISDLFYSKDYKLKFIKDKSVTVNYVNNKFVILKPADNFEGVGVIKFSKAGKTYCIPFQSELKSKVTFRFKPDHKYSKVNLFGSFNSWNRDSHPMAFNEKDGSYELTIPLDPGSYEYKFYADEGKEILDPANSDSLPNGLGGYNSILSVKPFHTAKNFLHVLGKEKTGSSLKLSFYYETNDKNSKFGKNSIIAIYNNNIVDPSLVEVIQNKIVITLDNKNLRNDDVLRVAVNDGGLSTYFQTVQFYNGDVIANGANTNYDNVMYAVLVDRFNDGDKSNSIPVVHPKLLPKANYFGGDLKGILNKINDGYFDSLGINTLWISPVIDNTDSAYQEYPAPHRFYSGYHGYWPVNPTGVEERFGTMQLLKDVVSTAHNHKMKVLLDYVANHIHIEHPWWKQHRDWFGKLELPDGRRNLRMWDEYRLTTWFEPFMPKFDYEHSKEALEAMTDNAVWWIKETGVDGFRHDAVKHVPNIYWRTLTKKIKEQFQGKKSIYQIGETFGSYQLVNSYVNNGQLDAQFNFILYDIAVPVFSGKTPFTALDEQMRHTFDVYGVNHLMGNIMDSHDKVRFMAFADDDINDTTGDAAEIGWNNPPQVDKPSSYEKLKLYIAYLASIPGVPVIYYGDEIGMTGAADPDNRRMMRFDDQLKPLEKKTLQDVSRILRLRDEHPALRYGDFLTLKADQENYAFIRSDMNERVVTVLNKGNKNSVYDLKLPDMYNVKGAEDLLTGEKISINGSILKINMNELSYKLFKLY